MKCLSDTRTYGHNRKAISAAAALVAIVAMLVIASVAYYYYPSMQAVQTQSKSSSQTLAQVCNPTTSQPIETKVGAVGGAGTPSTPGANIFMLQGGQYSTIGGDNPGTGGTGKATTVGAYPLQGLLFEFYATGAYPIWVTANVPAGTNLQSTPYVLGSYANVGTVTVQCIPSASNPNAYLWYVAAGLIESPSSAVGTGTGTGATTDVVALVTSNTGQAMSVTGALSGQAAMPTVTAIWTANLNLQAFANTGTGYPVNVYGSTSGLVEDYSTGRVYGSANVGSALFQMVLLVSTNDTSAAINLDPAAPYSLTMNPVTTNTVTAGSLNYLVSGFTGCIPSTTTSATTCLSVPFDVSSTKSGGHTAVTFTWVDMQQPAYLLAHLTTPALAAGYHASGASFGIAGLGGLTATSGNDAGAPTVLLEQSYTCIQKN